MARLQGLPAPTQQPKGKKKRSRACFFDLPGELRNRIYRLALLRKSDVYLAIKTKKLISAGVGYEGYSIKALQVGAGMPPILYASERLNAECRRIYFEENYFTFQDSSLCTRGIEAFRKFLDRSINNVWRLGVHRRFYIGDLKTPFEVHFVAVITRPLNRILLCRPQNKKQPFPGIKSKMRGTDVEPCRCQVKRLAYDCHSGTRTNGLDLFDFIEKYVALVRSTAVNEYITICPKCDSVMRT
ncbi:Hypothetical predicted protein [Lecanosticta acicola]|uniref:Uncharacterized protein n=1 Tax=Lecanosticta acicola TaxID=111012 RepID=A0AAI8Z3Z0_9PEZI|nr:Hypothetical predicted protein [Lecanosticta acicola]